MFQELQQLVNTFSYRKAVQVLSELRHDRVELQKFSQYIDKQFAPRAIEDRVIQLIAEYYDRAAKSTPLMLSASSRLSVTDSLVHHGEVPKPEILKDDVPAVIVKLRADQRLLRDERRAIHMTLEETSDDKLRGEKAKSIRELSKRIDKIFLNEKDQNLSYL